MSIRAAKFRDDDSARRYMEGILWPAGPACPRCGESKTIYKLRSRPETQHGLPAGIYKCAGCSRRFSVTTGTIFEGSHITLHKWLLACHLVCSAENGVSALQLQRELQLGSYRSARFMSQRINWALNRISQLSHREDEMAALLRIKPLSEMPRPGTRRQKSVWAEVDEELHGVRPQKTKRAERR